MQSTLNFKNGVVKMVREINKIILIGGDHHNGVGLARIFGLNGIKPYGIIVGDTIGNGMAKKSKFWEKIWHVDSNEDALKLIINIFQSEKLKPIVMPWSDGAALAIDNNYNKLKDYFVLPSIRGEQGKISFLMNKKNQQLWANELGIKTAPTEIIDVNFPLMPMNMGGFPIILKPVISAEGDKRDIKKCNSANEFINAIDGLRIKGYSRILCQKYIVKDYEMELFGAILKNSDITPFLLSEHYREWPLVAGTVSLHRFIVEPKLLYKAEELLKKVRESGFVGNIDIELFNVNGEVYLNEINFRNSGDVFACFNDNIFYPLYLYMDLTKQDISNVNLNFSNSYYAMNEATDLRHVVYGNLTFREWFKDLKRTKSFALWHRKDIKPAIYRYINLFAEMVRRRKKYGRD